MEVLLISYIPLILSIFLSRRMLQNAIQRLDDDLKIKLINYSTKDKSMQLIVIAGILVLFFVNLKFGWIPFVLSSYLALGILSLLVAISVYRSIQKLKNEGFPSWYLKEMLKGNLLRFLGILLFLGTLTFVKF